MKKSTINKQVMKTIAFIFPSPLVHQNAEKVSPILIVTPTDTLTELVTRLGWHNEPAYNVIVGFKLFLTVIQTPVNQNLVNQFLTEYGYEAEMFIVNDFLNWCSTKNPTLTFRYRVKKPITKNL